MLKEHLERSKNPKSELAKAKKAVKAFHALWGEGSDPTLHSILKEIQRSGLFIVPDSLLPIVERQGKNFDAAGENDINPIIDAWDDALTSCFSEFKEYVLYISDQSRFGTHQGIKGLEFPRVMVILDDEESRGFLFSYDKLFGAKAPTKADIDNQSQGKETSADRTRRLFYVTCSRAEESLAIIAYTKEPKKVKEYALAQEWFSEEEIIMNGGVKI